MSAFDKFKNRKSNLKATIEAMSKPTFEKDYFYMPTPDKNGIADATIRFLPQKDENKPVFVTIYEHIFQGDDNRWIYTMCPTTLGKTDKCEICRRNGILYNTNIPELRNIVSRRKRSHKYIANIVVVKDPQNPSNEGKVFPFKFGAALEKKISDALYPKYAGDVSVDVFDIFEGADFHLRFSPDKAKGGQRTYDASFFDKPSVLYDGDERQLNAVFDQLVDLDKFIARDRMMSPERMEERCKTAYSSFSTYFPEDVAVKTYGKTAPASPAFEPEKTEVSVKPSESDALDDIPWDNARTSSQEDDALAYFQQMANK